MSDLGVYILSCGVYAYFHKHLTLIMCDLLFFSFYTHLSAILELVVAVVCFIIHGYLAPAYRQDTAVKGNMLLCQYFVPPLLERHAVLFLTCSLTRLEV